MDHCKHCLWRDETYQCIHVKACGPENGYAFYSPSKHRKWKERSSIFKLCFFVGWFSFAAFSLFLADQKTFENGFLMGISLAFLIESIFDCMDIWIV